jgi:hypothetical protein
MARGTHRTDRGRCGSAIGPIGPMSPMPYGIRRRSLVEGVGGRSPFSGRLLAREHQPGCAWQRSLYPYSMDIAPFRTTVQPLWRIAISWSVIWIHVFLVVLLATLLVARPFPAT